MAHFQSKIAEQIFVFSFNDMAVSPALANKAFGKVKALFSSKGNIPVSSNKKMRLLEPYRLNVDLEEVDVVAWKENAVLLWRKWRLHANVLLSLLTLISIAFPVQKKTFETWKLWEFNDNWGSFASTSWIFARLQTEATSLCVSMMDTSMLLACKCWRNGLYNLIWSEW